MAASDQRQHTKQGQDTGIVAVPSLAERAGNFSDAASTLTGTVNGPFLAQTLTNRLGYAVNVGEPFHTQTCSSITQCVFPNGIIPASAFAVPPTKMLQYIPLPNIGSSSFESSAESLTIHDEKAAGRIDWNTDRGGNFSVYYFGDKYNLDNPYPSGFSHSAESNWRFV